MILFIATYKVISLNNIILLVSKSRIYFFLNITPTINQRNKEHGVLFSFLEKINYSIKTKSFFKWLLIW